MLLWRRRDSFRQTVKESLSLEKLSLTLEKLSLADFMT